MICQADMCTLTAGFDPTWTHLHNTFCSISHTTLFIQHGVDTHNPNQSKERSVARLFTVGKVLNIVHTCIVWTQRLRQLNLKWTIVKESEEREVSTMFERLCQHLFWNEKKDRKWGKRQQKHSWECEMRGKKSQLRVVKTRSWSTLNIPVPSCEGNYGQTFLQCIYMDKPLLPLWFVTRKLNVMWQQMGPMRSYTFRLNSANLDWLYLFMPQFTHWITEWACTVVSPTHSSCKRQWFTGTSQHLVQRLLMFSGLYSTSPQLSNSHDTVSPCSFVFFATH